MASYEVQRLPEVPAAQIVLYEDWDTSRDASRALNELLDIFDNASEPLYYVNDVTRAAFAVEDIIKLANLVTQGTQIVSHPNNKGVLVVVSSKLVELAAKGMNTATFGNVNVRTFSTLEEVMDYIHDQ